MSGVNFADSVMTPLASPASAPASFTFTSSVLLFASALYIPITRSADVSSPSASLSNVKLSGIFKVIFRSLASSLCFSDHSYVSVTLSPGAKAGSLPFDPSTVCCLPSLTATESKNPLSLCCDPEAAAIGVKLTTWLKMKNSVKHEINAALSLLLFFWLNEKFLTPNVLFLPFYIDLRSNKPVSMGFSLSEPNYIV